jgi:hypothetical protein
LNFLQQQRQKEILPILGTRTRTRHTQQPATPAEFPAKYMPKEKDQGVHVQGHGIADLPDLPILQG